MAHCAAHYVAHFAVHFEAHYVAHSSAQCVVAVAHNAEPVVQCAVLVQNGGKEFRFFHALLACVSRTPLNQTVSPAVGSARPDLVALV